MPARVQNIDDLLNKDMLAYNIADMYVDFEGKRAIAKSTWEETIRYVYATDTSQTTNAKLPWKNKTTIPKLCQIMDNLYANYTATMFPQRKSIEWEANEKDANSAEKRDAIRNYMAWVISQPSFKHEIDKIILDYIQHGNCIATVEWVDQRVESSSAMQFGYVGPAIKRISPMDIVFNPLAENFQAAPKIVRSLVSMGEVKEILSRLSTDENREEYEELWKYMRELRNNALAFEGEWIQKDNLFQIEGYTSFRDYLQSNTVEILTFYGDAYDAENDVFLKNHVITVVDRHKLIGKKPNPSYFGYPPIFHVPWRKRQDNLWGMGPLDNLVGMQYRMDHVENMRADVVDLSTYPIQKIKGYVGDFTWQPGEKISVDLEGDVELVTPDVNVLQANFELQSLQQLMEEMAGAPKEAMGFRTPGEKTKYEVQRLENAAARLFNNKIKQFEEQMLEPLLNAMLELARRNMTQSTIIKIFDDDLKVASFQSLTAEDITGAGRIKPVAARHFAEQAELIQNLTNLTSSGLWPVVQPHFSGYKLAKLLEQTFNIGDYNIVLRDVAIAEQAEAQKFAHTLEENVMNTISTPSGRGEDYDLSAVGVPPSGPAPAETEQTSDVEAQESNY